MKRKVTMQKHRPLSTEAGDQSQTIPCEIVVEQVAFVSGFSSCALAVPFQNRFSIVSSKFYHKSPTQYDLIK